jgi:hypothetical protein
LYSVFLAVLCVSLAGCGAQLPSNSSLAGGKLRGNLHGGQQPIAGASVQLYAAGTSGYGSSATALLSSPVITDASGAFSITGGYTCPSATSQLYIVATGGNPGLAPGTNNAAIALMAALGPCSLHGGGYTLDPNSFILINEVTTVASVYALAGFMGSDATHLGASSTNAIGLANSFSLVNNLVNVTTGTALAVTPAGNGTAPQATINTLGNIMAACVNSDGTGTACAALAAAATPTGGTAPTDTIQGILNVARNPANNVSALYGLATATPPFQPVLAAVPNDWVVSVTYTAGGFGGVIGNLYTNQKMAIDAFGNVWIPSISAGQYNVVELNSNGTVLSGSGGYTGGGLTAPTSLAIDPVGNVWVAGSGNVVKLSNSGTVLSGANGFTGGGLNNPFAVALDGQGNAWVSDLGTKSVIKLDNNGGILSGASGFQTGSTRTPSGVAIDRAGNAWVGNDDNTVTEFSNNGTLLSGSTGYPMGYGGVNSTPGVAIDASGNAWLNAQMSTGFFELSPSGLQLGGYSNCFPPGVVTIGIQFPLQIDGACYYSDPSVFALDGAGNVWGVVTFQWTTISHPPSTEYSSAVAEMSNTGKIVSGKFGYAGSTPLGSIGRFLNVGVQGIAIDGGGNVWVMLSGNTVAEFVGAATPVVTPFSLGVKNGTLGQRP